MGNCRVYSEFCSDPWPYLMRSHFPVCRLAHHRFDLASLAPGGALWRHSFDRRRDGDAVSSCETIYAQSGSCHLVARVLVLAVGRSRRDPFDANSSDYQNCLRSSSATRGSWPYSRGLRRERDRDLGDLSKVHAERLCHVAVPRARSVGASGIVRPLRPPSATWSSPQREARGAFGLRTAACVERNFWAEPGLLNRCILRSRRRVGGAPPFSHHRSRHRGHHQNTQKKKTPGPNVKEKRKAGSRAGLPKPAIAAAAKLIESIG